MFTEREYWFDISNRDTERWTGPKGPMFSIDTTITEAERQEKEPLGAWEGPRLSHMKASQHDN